MYNCIDSNYSRKFNYLFFRDLWSPENVVARVAILRRTNSFSEKNVCFCDRKYYILQVSSKTLLYLCKMRLSLSWHFEPFSPKNFLDLYWSLQKRPATSPAFTVHPGWEVENPTRVAALRLDDINKVVKILKRLYGAFFFSLRSGDGDDHYCLSVGVELGVVATIRHTICSMKSCGFRSQRVSFIISWKLGWWMVAWKWTDGHSTGWSYFTVITLVGCLMEGGVTYRYGPRERG